MIATNPAGIFCLEGEWEDDLRERQSVRPVLTLLEDLGEISYVHRDVSSAVEVKRYLRLWDDSRYQDFTVLYLATHGSPGALGWSHGETMTLDDLAIALDGVAHGCYVFLGSCSALLDDETVRQFVEDTGVKALIGYSADVDWVEGASFDLLVLARLAQHAATGRQARTLYGALTDRTEDLAAALRFTVVTQKETLRAG